MADPTRKLKPTDTARYKKTGELMLIVGVSLAGFVKARPLFADKRSIKHYAAIDFELVHSGNTIISVV